MTDWHQIVQRHSGLVWRTAYRLLGRDDEAADCLQETFLVAWEVSKTQKVRHWPALLVRVATRRALDRLRRRLRQASRSQDLSDWSSVPSRQPSPQDHAEAGELAQRLREAIGKLPEHQAEAFCLRCLDEFSYRDIARQMEMKVSAVSVLIFRARQKLAELLEQPVRQMRAEVEP